MSTIELDAELHRDVYKLEEKFQGKHGEIYKKRSEIISGAYEPTDDDCQLPGVEAQPENPTNGTSSGVPHFWLTAMKNVKELNSIIQNEDEEVLQHLIDVRSHSTTDPELSFQLQFHFQPNEHFHNAVLTKTYLMKCTPDDDDVFGFEGPEIFKTVGCDIDWKQGKDVTESSAGLKETSPHSFKAGSFFNFFNPPEMKPGDSEVGEMIEVSAAQATRPIVNLSSFQSYLENDFEVGHYLKERVIPRAVLFFTGEIDDDDMSDDGSIDDNIIYEEEENIEGGDN